LVILGNRGVRYVGILESLSMLKKLVAALFFREQRFWTVEEVRALIVKGDLSAAYEATSRLNAMTPNLEPTRSCICAEIAFRQNRDDEAESGFRNVLRELPGFADAHYGLSLILLEQGYTDIAVEHAIFAKNVNPNDARYLAQLGLCNVTAGNFPGAEIPLRQAIRLNDLDKASWNNLGVVLRSKGLPGEAFTCFEIALKLDPTFCLALQNLERLENEIKDSGSVRVPHGSTHAAGVNNSDTQLLDWELEWALVEEHRKKDRIDLAIKKAEMIALDWPDLSGPVCKLAMLYVRLGDLPAGIDALGAFLHAYPESAEAHACLGSVYMEANENALAAEHLKLAHEKGLEGIQLLNDLAQIFNRLEKSSEAVEFRRLAHAQEPSSSTRAQLAGSLVTACQYTEAIELFEALLEEDPSSENLVLGSYATAQAYQGQFEKALALMDKALSIQSRDASLRLLRAQINLLLGDFKQGWEDYSYRGLAYTKQFRVLPFAKWRGEDLNGKSIVVLAEQGLGDQVMFASCLPDLLKLNPAKITVEAIDRVAPTLARSFPECEVIHSRQDKGMKWAKELENVDYFVPLGNLPFYFRNSVSAFPGTPYLKPDSDRVSFWRDKLAGIGPKPWIGVSWRGGVQSTRKVVRSMSPTDLAPMSQSIKATWINLQYGDVADDLVLAENSNFQLVHWPEAISNLDEFAALIEALDCVVTVCNTTVHYAGALGKKVLVMAPKVPEWRYGLNNTHMPWYADVAVIRQQEAGNWATVIQVVNEQLSKLFPQQET
jgi:tetratricopeptide (TPR) repeat protein